MALQIEKNYFRNIMHFVADAGTDKFYFGVNFFVADAQTQLFFVV